MRMVRTGKKFSIENVKEIVKHWSLDEIAEKEDRLSGKKGKDPLRAMSR